MCLLLGNTRTFPQGDGPSVQLKVYGDEFYARYETMDGYTVLYDTMRERYCYAVLVKGHLVSSGAPMDKPVPMGLLRHLQDDKEIRNLKFDRNFNIMRPPSEPISGISATLGENKGLLPGKQLSREPKVRGLTILVNFKDETSGITAAHVDALLNGENYTAYGNYCSVKTYYKIMSSGRLAYENEVVGPITMPKNKTHYIKNKLMGDALAMAVDEYGLDLSRFDATDRGTIDAVNFLYAGETLYEGWLWPHNHFMNMSIKGRRAELYTIQSLGRDPVDMKIGTFCHESGHLICRFPDLYDYGKRDGDSDPSSGLGYYCLMSSGNHLNNGRTPSPVCAYLRHLAGWMDQVHILNDGGTFNIEHGNYNALYKYQVPNRPNEYFLIENRSRVGMDTSCPSNGLAVYHCDTQGSNEWQGGSADAHYQCALIQADGARHLENNRNRGDNSDLFVNKNGLALSHDTVPSSKAWGGMESGLSLFDVSASGKTMTFKVGNPQAPDNPSNTLIRESRPSVLIPDDTPEGVSDTITMTTQGTLTQIAISVDITHPHIGDLTLELIPPHGTPIVLRKKKGGCKNDIRETYKSNTLLADLQGREILGPWTLKVTDLRRRATGKLRSWKIEAEYNLKTLDFSEEKEVNLPLPDNDPQGVQDTMTVTRGGQVNGLTVAVDISHTYHGDLRVKLMAPSGKSATLVEFNTLGSASGALVREFSHDSLSALKALIGETAVGDWTLWVSDNWHRDIGTLNRWSLHLEC